MTSQKDPCTFIYSCTRSLGGKQNRGTGARFRRGGGRSAEEKRGKSTRAARATCGCARCGLGWPGRGSPTASSGRRRRQAAAAALQRPWAAASGPGSFTAAKRMRFPGSFGVEEDWRWGLCCAVGAAAMADGGELDSGELEAGAEVGELLRE